MNERRRTEEELRTRGTDPASVTAEAWKELDRFWKSDDKLARSGDRYPRVPGGQRPLRVESHGPQLAEPAGPRPSGPVMWTGLREDRIRLAELVDSGALRTSFADKIRNYEAAE